jgi:hypothetical protein
MDTKEQGWIPSGIPLDDMLPGERYQLSLVTGPDIAGRFFGFESQRGRPLVVVLSMAGRMKRIERTQITIVKYG